MPFFCVFMMKLSGSVGLNWFASEPEVPPEECVATNGALDVGTCHSDASCTNSGGVASGTCSNGGVCCICESRVMKE